MILTFIQCSFSAFSSVSDNLTAALLIYFWSPGPLGGSSSAMKPRPDSVGSHWWYCWLSMVIIGDGIELCCKTISVWLKSRNKISKIGAVLPQKILLLEDKTFEPQYLISALQLESTTHGVIRKVAVSVCVWVGRRRFVSIAKHHVSDRLMILHYL